MSPGALYQKCGALIEIVSTNAHKDAYTYLVNDTFHVNCKEGMFFQLYASLLTTYGSLSYFCWISAFCKTLSKTKPINCYGIMFLWMTSFASPCSMFQVHRHCSHVCAYAYLLPDTGGVGI